MIPILFERDETLFDHNGLGRLQNCLSCVVTEERNGIYECDFEYPIDGAHYSEIQLGRIIGVTHNDTDDVQPFDIVGYSKPINGTVSFHCVHISYRQSYMVVTGKNIQSLSLALSRLKSATPQNPFSYYADRNVNAYCGAYDGKPKTVKQMLGGVEGSILDAYGGEYEWDKFAVRNYKERGVKRDFTIRYGVNMSDFKDDVDCQGTYNACIPFWTTEDQTVIGNKVVSTDQTYNGRELCMPLDLSDKFETAPTKAQLQTLAGQYLRTEKTASPVRTIEVSFMRLQDTNEYAQFAPLFTCNLCDTITVIFPDYNIKDDFKIVKTTWNVLQERYDDMELGTLSTTLSEALGVTDKSGGASTYIQHGVVQIGSVATHTISEVLVTFDEPFPATPVVVAGLYSGSSGYGMGSVSVGVRGISSTGFYARVFNNDSVARIPDVEWIAIL